MNRADKYQNWVTTKLPTKLSSTRVRNRLLTATLGLAGESGEVVDLVKKHLCHGRPLDLVKLREELGDAQFYLAALADYYGISLSEIMAANRTKLNRRYPGGFVLGGGVREKTQCCLAATKPGKSTRKKGCGCRPQASGLIRTRDVRRKAR